MFLGIHFAPTTHYSLVHPSNLTTATKPEACRCRVTICTVDSWRQLSFCRREVCERKKKSRPTRLDEYMYHPRWVLMPSAYILTTSVFVLRLLLSYHRPAVSRKLFLSLLFRCTTCFEEWWAVSMHRICISWRHQSLHMFNVHHPQQPSDDWCRDVKRLNYIAIKILDELNNCTMHYYVSTMVMTNTS